MTCSIPTTNNSNLKEYIHDQILKDVIEGTLQPNMILHEKKLMEQYGVSRSPVREALIQLCSEGTLCNYPKRGYEVSSITGHCTFPHRSRMFISYAVWSKHQR